ncbi:hypothetical protein GCM10027176_03610 [Actinoallomurus bryophytorum]|uniref:Uncharacterized protein n=1 Tax=Actinoallomurus bryophytorum TaxID=1490222 RepID=A0A543CJY3_9ACTN|nr:hypothetical protein FB559_2945 [Actinoallomurus bryophytorum]
MDALVHARSEACGAARRRATGGDAHGRGAPPGRVGARPVVWVGGGRGTVGAGQTVYMQNPQPSGAKGFALLIGIMVAIVLAIMVVAVVLSPHH